MAHDPTKEELLEVLNRLSNEDRLRCVVAGKETGEGKPAPECPKIISDHRLMCAGCAADRLRYWAGVAEHVGQEKGEDQADPTPTEIEIMEDMFGRWSAAVMYSDGTGKQTKSWGSETDCVRALTAQFPGVPISSES